MRLQRVLVYFAVCISFGVHSRAELQALPFDPKELSSPAPPLFLLSSHASDNQDFVLLASGERRSVTTIPPKSTIVRLWFTSSDEQVRVKLVFPDRPPLILWDGQKGTAFQPSPPLTVWHNRAFIGYLLMAVPKGASLEVVNFGKHNVRFFYQVNYRSSLENYSSLSDLATALNRYMQRWAPLWDGLSDSHLINLNAHSTKWLAYFVGNGWLTGIELQVPKEAMQWLSLQVWDDEHQLADVPLTTAFGLWFGGTSYQSLWTCARDEGKFWRLLWRLPIPFRSSLELRLHNRHRQTAVITARWWVRWTDEPPPYRLWLARGSERTKEKKPLTLAEVKGQGTLLGVMVGAQQTVSKRFRLLEGDEQIIADDVLLNGTGTEDFFNSAWYFPDNPFSLPMHGLIKKRSVSPLQFSAYRWFLFDRIFFRRSFRFSLEHGGQNTVPNSLYHWLVVGYANR